MKNRKGYVNVDIELDEQTFLRLAIMAHEKDMTFNAFVNMILKKYIKELEKKSNK